MCGIFGIRSSGVDLNWLTEQATRRLHHRGPDDSGLYVSSEDQIALGHVRLSIVDLSPLGHQPMRSTSGRFVIVFNGEIYNYKELRRQCEALGRVFVGHSDTEVMLACVEQWGVGESLRRFVGMFAFAIWDSRERSLILARDRLGEKPLYYGWVHEDFMFASELKAMRLHPSWKGDIDRAALGGYLRHGYVPGPRSIFDGIMKVPPGSYIKLAQSDSSATDIVPVHYWAPREIWSRSKLRIAPGAAVEELDQLLSEAVSLQMVADVPLGAFLSGGVDSSTIVALMQKQSCRPVKTFTIGFSEREFNEAPHAGAVARHLGTEHHELYVSPAEALAVIPRLPEIWCEPFADSSQIPTFLVSALARRHVTVSLSGDGGDELFLGYERYAKVHRLSRILAALPPIARRATVGGVKCVSPATWDSILGPWLPAVAGDAWRNRCGDRIYKICELLETKGLNDLYRNSVSAFWHPERWLTNGVDSVPSTWTGQPSSPMSAQEFLAYRDIQTYLPDDILVKVDRAGMAVSLEGRVPLLDHRVVEFAAKLPPSLKVRDGQSKWVLRQVLYRYVPRALIDRPKQGFGVPIAAWLRGPLREWAESLLSESKLSREGLWNVKAVRTMWQEHVSQRRHWPAQLWHILMFQAWLEAQSNAA